MIRNHIFMTLLLSLISTVTVADSWQDPDQQSGKEPSKKNSQEPGKSVEKLERQKIIKELSYRLDTKLACKQKLIWTDKGSGADLDGFFYIPSAESSYYIIGGYASRKGGANSKKCAISVRQSKNNPEDTPKLLVPPSDWSLIWTDKGSGANADGSMWHAVPPGKGYVCLGSVMQKGYKKPVLSNYRCVHSGLTKKISNKSIIWSDKGSGADRDVTVFKLPNSKTFIAVGRKTNAVKVYGLNDTASIKPDAAIVEKLLAERMEEINKDKEAEKEHIADEETKENKRIAEDKRLAEEKAEEVEKKQEAEEAAVEEKLAAEAEAEKQEQETEKKQQAEALEQEKILAVKAAQEKLEQRKEDIEKADIEKIKEPQQQSVTEMVVAEKPDVSKEIDQQQVIEKTGEKDSKMGLKVLFAFMLMLLIYTANKVFRLFINIVKGDK